MKPVGPAALGLVVPGVQCEAGARPPPPTCDTCLLYGLLWMAERTRAMSFILWLGLARPALPSCPVLLPFYFFLVRKKLATVREQDRRDALLPPVSVNGTW